MATIQVNVKWGKELVPVEVKAGQTPDQLFAHLQERTGVPIARQKLMARGAWKGVLKTGMEMKLTDGQNIMLMGTADVLLKPAVETKFLEDITEAEQAQSGLVLPAGFANLGNTCYMNSTLQCLRAVPELRASLSTQQQDLAGALNTTYQQLDLSTQPVEPATFVATLRSQFPQFAQTGRGGGFSQQDAEELYSSLFANLASSLKDGETNTVDKLFGLEMEETLSCPECEAEPDVVRKDTARKLICNIQGGTAGDNVNHLYEGLKLGLVGSLGKNSQILGRDAVWTKKSAVSKLSPYLCIQYMRFFWKATPDSADHTGVKCKIMRPVSFTDTLDAFPYCNAKLQAAIKANRDRLGAKLDLDADKEPEAKKAKADDDATMEEPDEDLAAALALSMKAEALSEHAALLESCGLDKDFQGHYELFAIVTHKGRSADGGHYMGWVKREDGSWLVFDDDFVSESSWEFVQGLKGGGDEHMSYLQFYRAKKGGI